jgi:hypothetical protein
LVSLQQVRSGKFKGAADADEVIRTESPVRAVGDDRGENEFPLAEPAVEVGRARAGDHDRHELLPARFLEQGS